MLPEILSQHILRDFGKSTICRLPKLILSNGLGLSHIVGEPLLLSIQCLGRIPGKQIALLHKHGHKFIEIPANFLFIAIRINREDIIYHLGFLRGNTRQFFAEYLGIAKHAVAGIETVKEICERTELAFECLVGKSKKHEEMNVSCC